MKQCGVSFIRMINEGTFSQGTRFFGENEKQNSYSLHLLSWFPPGFPSLPLSSPLIRRAETPTHPSLYPPSSSSWIPPPGYGSTPLSLPFPFPFNLSPLSHPPPLPSSPSLLSSSSLSLYLQCVMLSHCETGSAGSRSWSVNQISFCLCSVTIYPVVVFVRMSFSHFLQRVTAS